MNPFMLSNILESVVGIGQNWGHIQKKTHLSRVLVQCDMVEKKKENYLPYFTFCSSEFVFLLVLRPTHGYRNIQVKKG